MELRTGARLVFAVKAFYKNDDSFVIAQREFGREFGIHRNRAVPSGHAINLVSKLRGYWFDINRLNAELNLIYHLLILLGDLNSRCCRYSCMRS
jgi:hypothetical protein